MALLFALIALCSLAVVFGLIFGVAAIRFRVDGDPIV
ncbi:electron transport complex subunit RsxB, partial [Pseudoalteromonas sp. S979]